MAKLISTSRLMKEEDYPALYLAANAASIDAQFSLLRLHKWTGYLLILGAALAIFSEGNRTVSVLSAVIFLCSLFLVVYGHQKKLQSKWYQARALAESIKTATWRLMMGAEPFPGKSLDEIELFRKLLIELLQENKGIGEHLSGDWSNKDQVTPFMLSTRASSYSDKKAIYLTSRIDDQRDWYTKKSGDNRRESSMWFGVICLLYAGAIGCLLVRIGWPDLSVLPIEVFAVAASSALGWTQIKRFGELASAYGLAGHEIGIIKSRFLSISSPTHLARFVSDAENAFSREHTQWAARRDH